MRYVCDAPGGKTWFQIETEAEAAQESDLMSHTVAKYFRQAHERATASYAPRPGPYIEQDIGLKAHIQRVMPMFLTLRDAEGTGLVTAMLPQAHGASVKVSPIIVGIANADPYPQHGEAIKALGDHLGLTLDRTRCYPYRRG